MTAPPDATELATKQWTLCVEHLRVIVESDHGSCPECNGDRNLYQVQTVRSVEALESRLESAEAALRLMAEDSDRRLAGEGQHRDADGRRHRLVQVEHVETLPLEHGPNSEQRARAEDDVRQGPVRGHDDGAADRDHVGWRIAVAADARMQHAREVAGRIVAHDRARVVPEPPERLRLELGMLDHASPEGPAVRNHDAHLHLTKP